MFRPIARRSTSLFRARALYTASQQNGRALRFWYEQSLNLPTMPEWSARHRAWHDTQGPCWPSMVTMRCREGANPFWLDPHTGGARAPAFHCQDASLALQILRLAPGDRDRPQRLTGRAAPNRATDIRLPHLYQPGPGGKVHFCRNGVTFYWHAKSGCLRLGSL